MLACGLCCYGFVALAMLGAVLVLLHFIYSSPKWSPVGKHILITGGSSGIGKAAAIQLAKQGANITILARNKPKLEEAKEEIEKVQGKNQWVQTISVDVSDHAAVTEALKQHLAKHGPIDVVIASAGVTNPQYFEDIPMESFQWLMNVNYFGIVSVVKAVLPQMKQRKSGKLVFISSMAGQIGLFGYSAYAPTKFALRGFADCLSHEVLSYNISVSLSYPPDTETPMLEEENKLKPLETKKLSEGAGTLSAEQVASTLIDGMINNRYHIYHSLEGRAVAMATAGMSPAESVLQTVLECIALPILRVAGVLMQWQWRRSILSIHNQKPANTTTRSSTAGVASSSSKKD